MAGMDVDHAAGNFVGMIYAAAFIDMILHLRKGMGAGMEKGINKGFDISKLTIEEIVFFAFYIILSVTKGLGFYEWQKIFILFIIPAFFFGLLKILISRYTKRQRIIVIVLLIMTAVVCYESGEVGILFVMFTILGMKNISVDKVLRLGLWVWAICSVLISTVSYFMIEHTVYRIDSKLGLDHIFRWSLGFTHPNTLHTTYFALCAYIIYNLRERFGFKHFILLMLGNILVVFYSVSYTGFALVTILLAGGIYVSLRPRFCLPEKMIVNLMLPFFLYVSFAFPLRLYSSGRIQQLNFLLNTRIYLANIFLQPECLSPFGVRMSYLEQIRPYLSIDNSYIWALVHYGVIPFVLFILAYFVLIFDYSRRQKTKELVLIVCFLGVGYMEPLLFNTSFKNITLIFLGELLFRQKEGAEEYCLIPALRSKTEALTAFICAKIPARIWQSNQIPIWIKGAWKTHRKIVTAGVIAGALFGAVIFGICYSSPKGYIVPRQRVTWEDKSYITLDSKDDPEYEGYKVLNYVDDETPMQLIDGESVTLEWARYLTGSILIGGLAGYLLTVGGIFMRKEEW